MSANLFLALAALLFLFSRQGKTFRAWTLEEIARSPSADKLGIDNSVPSHYAARAAGLGMLAGAIEALGFRVTSAYRSEALTDAIYAAKGQNKPYAGGGTHGACRALDVDIQAGDEGTGAIATVKTALLADPFVSHYIDSTLNESDHLHVAFDANKLEELGATYEYHGA